MTVRLPLVDKTLRNPPAMQETWVGSLRQEGPLGKGMTIHSSVLAWRSHGQRSLVGYNSWGHEEWDMTERPILSLSSYC